MPVIALAEIYVAGRSCIDYSYVSALTVDTDPGVDDTIAMYVIVNHLILSVLF